MKHLNIKFLLALLISMLGIKAFAYNIEVKNTDGVTIYYSYISSTDLEVTRQGDSYKYAGKVVIPESVTYNGTTFSVSSIGDYAFQQCTDLTNITIPNSVTSIGNNSFQGCSGLTSISIPNSVTSIGNSAFQNCSGLMSITIPNSVTSIGRRAFYGTAWYDNQPDGLVYAGKVAYNYKGTMPSNNSIVLNEGTLGIANSAFYDCSSLASISIPNSVTNIGQSAFEGTTWYNNQPDGLVYAGKVAYKYKGTMPSNTNIVLEEGTLGIAGSAFYKCSGLASITIPNSVTSIGRNAFCDCTGLTSITIGNSVTSIGSSAFSGCSSLTSLTIGNSVTSIERKAFENCSSLTEVHISDLTAWCNITFNNDYYSNPLYYAKHLYLNGEEITELNIPNSVTRIDNYAFYGCSSLKSVTIPNSVTSIGSNAFIGCTDLTSITIGNSVTSIGSSAFAGCSGLKNITTGNSVTYIGGSAFSGCSSLTSITIPNSVTSIERSAFQYCSSLTSITIPNSVTSIGDFAFSGCSDLTSIAMGNSVTSIGWRAFENCSNLTEVHISNLATWCNIEFYNDFYSNPLYYAKHLYLNGKEITELNIPNSVTRIDNYAFENCSSLKSVTIPNTVTNIGNYAFQGCSGLKNVSIGNSVTSIGQNAFLGCDNLLIVKSDILEPFNCKDVFTTNTLRNGTLYIPAGTKDLYTRFDGWREFLKIEEVGGEQEQYVWLSMKDGRGSTMLKVKKGAAQELAVKPEAGWKILMATMDGTDISAQIKSGNVYTTPAIMNDATINIVYEMDDPSGTVTARQSKADIKVVDDGVIISNAEPQSRCVVYSSSGQQVVNTVIEDGSRKITLQKGQVYILTINGRTLKFAL